MFYTANYSVESLLFVAGCIPILYALNRQGVDTQFPFKELTHISKAYPKATSRSPRSNDNSAPKANLYRTLPNWAGVKLIYLVLKDSRPDVPRPVISVFLADSEIGDFAVLQTSLEVKKQPLSTSTNRVIEMIRQLPSASNFTTLS
jgi:hypothetical protein